MNADLQLALEKQLIKDLPEEFFDIDNEDYNRETIWSQITGFLLVIGAIFQAICLLALYFLPSHPEEKYFYADSQNIDKVEKPEKLEKVVKAPKKDKTRKRK